MNNTKKMNILSIILLNIFAFGFVVSGLTSNALGYDVIHDGPKGCFEILISHSGSEYHCPQGWFVEGVRGMNAGWTVVERPICCPSPGRTHSNPAILGIAHTGDSYYCPPGNAVIGVKAVNAGWTVVELPICATLH